WQLRRAAQPGLGAGVADQHGELRLPGVEVAQRDDDAAGGLAGAAAEDEALAAGEAGRELDDRLRGGRAEGEAGRAEGGRRPEGRGRLAGGEDVARDVEGVGPG